jgi:hypothetical protein
MKVTNKSIRTVTIKTFRNINKNQNYILEQIKTNLMQEILYIFQIQNLSLSHLLSNNLKFKIYKAIIFLVLYSFTLKDCRCLRRESQGEYLALKKREQQKYRKTCIMMSFIICIFHQIFFFLGEDY